MVGSSWILYKRGINSLSIELKLPTKSLVQKFKLGKAQLFQMLHDSVNPLVKIAQSAILTGRKWEAKNAAETAESSLKMKEVIGSVATGRAGLGLHPQRMVSEEIHHFEEIKHLAIAVAQPKEGAWTRWEKTKDRTITEITSTRQRPDLVTWPVNSKKVIIAELTIEVNIDRARQRKLEKYEDLREQSLRMAGQQTYFLLRLDVKVYFEINLYIFNWTRTFISREEGIYKKDPKQDCNGIWTDMTFVQIKHHPTKSGSIVRYCWGTLG